jgi:hypothetical protein
LKSWTRSVTEKTLQFQSRIQGTAAVLSYGDARAAKARTLRAQSIGDDGVQTVDLDLL